MLLTIHNLPTNTRYSDVKSLIESKCGLSGVLLDHLVKEGNQKKVTVGVAEEEDAAIIVRKINGIYINGMQLYVEDVRQKKASEQPYRSNVNLLQVAQNQYQQPQQPIIQSSMNQQPPLPVPPPFIDMSMPSMYYMPTGQTLQTNFGQTQPPFMSEYPKPEYTANSESTSGFRNERNSNNTQAIWQTPQSNWEQPSTSSIRSYDDQQYSTSTTEQRDSRQRSRRRDKMPYMETDNNQHDTRKRKASPQRDPWSSRRKNDVSPWKYDRETPPHREPQNSFNRFNNSFGNNSDHSFSAARNSSMHMYGSHVTEPNEGARTRQRGTRWDGPVSPRPKEREYSSFRSSNSPNVGDNTSSYKKGPVNNWKQSNYCPPAKRYKNDNDHFKPGPPYSHNSVNRTVTRAAKKLAKGKKKTMTLKYYFQRDLMFRSQAAATLTNQLLLNIKGTKVSIPDNQITDRLKRTIRSRLAILCGYDLQVHVPKLISRYRVQFPMNDDQQLFDYVLHLLEREKACEQKKNVDTGKATSTNQETTAKQSGDKGNNNKDTNTTTVPKDVPLTKLPTYPEGNKRLAQQQKLNNRMEFINGSDALETNPILEAALNEELNIMQKLMEDECLHPRGDGEKLFCDRFPKPPVLESLITALRVNLTKRLTGQGSLPVLRVVGFPKPPRKADLEQFLLGRGVLSLRKAVKKHFFIATCDSFESMDKLCAMNTVKIGDVDTAFKPMYLSGIQPKLVRRLERKRANALAKSNVASEKTINNDSNIEGDNDNKNSTANVHPLTNKSQMSADPDKTQHDHDNKDLKVELQNELIALKMENDQYLINQIESSLDRTEALSSVSFKDNSKSIENHSKLERNDSQTEMISEKNVTETKKDGTEENQTNEDVEIKSDRNDENTQKAIQTNDNIETKNEYQGNDKNALKANQSTKEIETKNELQENVNDDQKENDVKKSDIREEEHTHETISNAGLESKDQEKEINDNNKNYSQHLATDNTNETSDNFHNKEIESITETTNCVTERRSLNVEDFAVIDEVTGDDLDSDGEEENVKYEANIEIPDIDQVDEDDLEDY